MNNVSVYLVDVDILFTRPPMFLSRLQFAFSIHGSRRVVKNGECCFSASMYTEYKL